ncbi:3-deoxy-D-manno-octulosonic acid transferase [Sediminicola sp. 1XM1-17]|uniref:3-deoxy-D-manno-octulosonic acid transferase n=1 Tax=Sediminicola sp. 1XM1-17 TaxID=3127702 RepID=UPI00307893F8
MLFLYNLAVLTASFLLRLIANFSPKLQLFVNGRKDVFSQLEQQLSQEAQVIWVHTASLGEFEQGLPIIEKLKLAYPDFKILVTFFSPSGYEVKKNTPVADLVLYLPLDTKKNAERFIALGRPKLAIFVKYEIWPNYLQELAAQKIPTLLISAIFTKRQIFFKGYGGFMRRGLASFSHIFVQDKNSLELLKSINIHHVTIGGDTRFDRVSEILARNNALPFMDTFKQENLCMVAGSTWPEDEAVLLDYINRPSQQLKYAIAPHNIKDTHIQKLKGAITKKTVLFSELDRADISNAEVLIIDTVGLLTKIYSYADIAYVGGGFATGLHNTLEPAVFGIPVLIGPQYQGFKEAEDLVALQGVLPILNKTDLQKTMDELVQNTAFHQKTGDINTTYINQNKGASTKILDHIKSIL